MDFNTLEIIGLAFLSGLHISEMVEDLKEEENEEQEENKTEKEEKDADVEISVKKITPEEMGKIFDDLKNKLLGGKE